MTPKITDEQRKALMQRAPGQPVPIEDDETHQVYYIVDEIGIEQRNIDAIQAGMDAAAEGRVSTLEEVDARIRKKLGMPPVA